jgi:hypothetical protein
MPFKNRVARGWLPALAFVAVAVVHGVVAWVGGPARNWHGQTSEYYALLTDAFLAGQTSLLVQPAAELLALPNPYDSATNGRFRLHDASLYHGKYYLYFGPTPALVLFLPYKVLTNSHLPSRIAVALFCAGGLACSCALFFLLAKREKWDCPRWFASAAVLSLGTAPGVAFLVTRPSFYEVAISAGYCFTMAAFALITYSLEQDSPRTAPLVGAGLCFGLAAGCRPDFVLIAILMVVLVAWRTRSHKTRALAFVAPVVLCGALLAAYNYARFQNPFDFGIQYTLLDNRSDLNDHFGHSLGNLLPSLSVLVFSPVRLPPADLATGLLSGSPIALIGLLTPCILRYGRVRYHVKLGSTRFAIYCVYVSALSILILLALLGFTLRRYTVDFAPGFVLLSWCLLAAMWQAVQGLAAGKHTPFRIVVVAAALYPALLDFSICVSRIPR